VDPATLKALLESIRAGRTTIEEGAERLARLPLVDLGHSQVDLHRELRCGAPETVFGAGKTPEELVEVGRTLVAHHGRLLATRVTPEGARALVEAIPGARHHPRSRLVTVGADGSEAGEGRVLVVAAGTSDAPVAEEAAVTARFNGARVERLDDVGVAGIHRVLRAADRLREARVVVVVAGMEGALPSVVGGLVERPVIAVPTSVGYGASYGGLAALLGMLNACAAGVLAVNIDNGYGAGYAAALINRDTARGAK